MVIIVIGYDGELFRKVMDPRTSKGREYKLEYILTFALLAIMSGAQNYKEIYLFIMSHYEKLKSFFQVEMSSLSDPFGDLEDSNPR
jgi:hypothetical protein